MPMKKVTHPGQARASAKKRERRERKQELDAFLANASGVTVAELQRRRNAEAMELAKGRGATQKKSPDYVSGGRNSVDPSYGITRSRPR